MAKKFKLIKTAKDVITFFQILQAEGLNFHPDDNFSDYIKFGSRIGRFNEEGEYIVSDGTPLYTPQEAKLRQDMLDTCFEVCDALEEDIYALAEDVFMAEIMKQIDEQEAKWEARKYGELPC